MRSLDGIVMPVLSSDGSRAAGWGSRGAQDGQVPVVQLWEIQSGRLLWTLDGCVATALDISADGSVVAFSKAGDQGHELCLITTSP